MDRTLKLCPAAGRSGFWQGHVRTLPGGRRARPGGGGRPRQEVHGILAPPSCPHPYFQQGGEVFLQKRSRGKDRHPRDGIRVPRATSMPGKNTTNPPIGSCAKNWHKRELERVVKLKPRTDRTRIYLAVPRRSRRAILPGSCGDRLRRLFLANLVTAGSGTTGRVRAGIHRMLKS